MSNCTLCPCAILAGCKKSKAEVIILFPATSADVSVRHKWSSTSLAICYTLLLASLYHDRPSLESTYAQSSEANQVPIIIHTNKRPINHRNFLEGVFLEEFFGRNFLGGILWEELFGRKFLGGILWEEFFGRIFLGGIFWEEFFGKNFSGGILWEEFFVYIVKFS